MPITVDKSQLAIVDEAALQIVLDTLELQSTHVKKVSVLANFSVDKLATLQYGTTIVQGLVVQVAKEYKLSTADMSWFHPEIASGRSLFEIDEYITASKLASTELDGLQSSIGEYSISHPDEFGCESVQHHIVVDTSVTAALQSIYQKWLSTNITAGEVDKQWKKMKFGELYGISTATQQMRCDIATQLSPGARLVYADTIRSVFSDTSSVYFTNNVVKRETNEILVKSSALGGYRMYNASNEAVRFYPSTLGTATAYYSWKDIPPKNCQRIEKSCSWDGELTFNAAVMTPPIITGKDVRKMEDTYELFFRDTLSMNNARFSPSDSIRDSLPPIDTFNLHPNAKQSSVAQSFISSPITMDHPILHKLMMNIQALKSQFPEFQLLNPALIKDGRLKIPLDIYKQFAAM